MGTKQRLEDIWEQYLKKGLGGLTDYELLSMMDDVNELRESAFQELLRRGTNLYNLRYIMRVFKSYRERAWKELVRIGPNSYDLEYIINFVDSLKGKASRLLRQIERHKERKKLKIIS